MTNWYYKNGNESEQGPFSVAELKYAVQAGHIVATTQVRKDGRAWVAATKVTGLLASASQPEPASSPDPSNPFESHLQVPQPRRHQISGDLNRSSASVSNFLDGGFTRFVTTACIEYIWFVSAALAGGSCVVGAIFIVVGLATGSKEVSASTGFWMLFAAPVTLFLTRITLEVLVVMFRIEAHLRTIRDQLSK